MSQHEPSSATPASTPVSRGQQASIRWTAEANKLLEARSGGDAPVGTAKLGDAEALYQWINDQARPTLKPAVEQGSFYKRKHAALPKKVTWAYFAAKLSDKLDPEVQGAAFALFTVDSQTGVHVASAMVRMWIAHAGLPFALEAWAHSLRWQGSFSGKELYLVTHDPTDLGVPGSAQVDMRFQRHRIPALLRARLAAASTEEQQATFAVAQRLAEQGRPIMRIGVAAVLDDEPALLAALGALSAEDRSWIPLDGAVMHPLSPETMSGVIATLSERSCVLIGTHHHRLRQWQINTDVRFFLLLLREHGVAAVAPIAAWVRRTVDHIAGSDSSRSRPLLLRLKALLDVLDIVHDAPALADSLAHVINQLGRNKYAKDDDPCTVAHRLLNAMPAAALAAVQAAAKQNRTWARTLLPRLKRATGHVELLPVAAAETIPAELRSGGMNKPPAFWDAKRLPQIMLAAGGALPPEAVDALGNALNKSDADVLAVVKAACTAASLARFSWELFMAWEAAGGPSKEKWAMMALAHFGDDDAALQLTARIRKWPGQSQHTRAINGLEVLAGIGSDVALICLDGIAQKIRFKALQRNARQKMDAIAARRGFSSEELADRLVPHLDLQDDGSMELDFGTRSFRVGFDDKLRPYLIDAAGEHRKSLPKPADSDDRSLAENAAERFNTLKKNARALAPIQLARLELAMGLRQWSAADFEALLVQHPLMIHLTRRLVWAVVDEAGTTEATFRVAEDRSYASIDDEPFALDKNARVALPHPLVLNSATRTRWKALFHNYEIKQPFAQLDREVFRLQPDDAWEDAIGRYEGRMVESSKVRGLAKMGWRHGAPQDAGVYYTFGKQVNRRLQAWIHFERGLSVSNPQYDDERQELGLIVFSEREIDPWGKTKGGEPIASIHPVIVSEVLRDIEALGGAEQAS